MVAKRIRHTVAFTLVHWEGAAEGRGIAGGAGSVRGQAPTNHVQLSLGRRLIDVCVER